MVSKVGFRGKKQIQHDEKLVLKTRETFGMVTGMWDW